jgi:MFS transporter, FSR family, fosmidomycin resistance protein
MTTSANATSALGASESPRQNQDTLVITLIGLVHGTSHFFHMLLPPLFPILAVQFGLSFAQLGLLTTVFFIVSGVGQALSGFLVDRYGALKILALGLTLFVLAALSLSQATTYAGLMLGAVLAGAGNAVFHPVDFTILNRRVSTPRLGHAYSTHGITGNLGWAAAPLFLLGVASISDWRTAYLCAAALPLIMLALVWLYRDALHVPASWKPKSAAAEDKTFDFMKLPVVWLSFAFFFFSTIALGAIQNFAVPALKTMYSMPLAEATFALSSYMIAGAFGMFIGGFIAPKFKRPGDVITLAMGSGVVMMVLLGSSAVPAALAPMLVALAGFGVGIAGPSRDMMIKKATPAGASGRVYGMVYSGLDIGLALVPVVLGAVMDKGLPQWVFYGSAIGLVGAVFFARNVSDHVGNKAMEKP